METLIQQDIYQEFLYYGVYCDIPKNIPYAHNFQAESEEKMNHDNINPSLATLEKNFRKHERDDDKILHELMILSSS